ncbi:MAG: phosphodiester glycosidase family protein [Candidatus Obscuribacterales bacterium]|nr:phosphodiester glycosidase family protein [Candidatus Obscuribacterales bacterium]
MPASTKKKSKSMEILSWAIDLSVIALLIYYFSNPQNQSNFWSAVNSGINSAKSFIEASGVKLAKKKTASIQAASKKENEASLQEPLPPSFVPPPLATAEQLAAEIPGDCIPPEMRDLNEIPEAAKMFYTPEPLAKQTKVRKGKGKALQFSKRKIEGVPFYQVTVDLNDPDSFIVIRLPKKATQANSSSYSAGHELFESFVKEYPSAVQVNGTFFSKDEEERVMGNMVSEGKMLKYSPWENYGTTLSLREGDYPEMVTARAEGKPRFDEHWFSLTCGPRLVKEGEVWLNPELEGFADPHVLGVGPRSAIGFPKSRDRLYLITFLQGLSLKQEAKIMKALGCYEAMNLDGGASKALAHDNKLVMKPGRGLTNVIVVYDSKHKAPPETLASWQAFQESKNQTQGQ